MGRFSSANGLLELTFSPDLVARLVELTISASQEAPGFDENFNLEPDQVGFKRYFLLKIHRAMHQTALACRMKCKRLHSRKFLAFIRLKRSPTIKEVALRAGVSVATVSRVVNHSGPVAEQTRELIDQIIRESGFRPNSIGRQLKTARTHTIGVLVPSLKNPVFADAVDGIQGAAERDGYRILLASSTYRAEREMAAVETFLRSRVDGLVLTVADEQNSQALSTLAASRLPFVLMFNPVRDSSFSTISIDNRKAARELVDQLLGLGHRRITMIAGKHSESDRSVERQAGFRDALGDYGIGRTPISEVGFESPDIVAQVKALHKSDPSTTAYFCSTDLIAIATIRALNQIGCDVPKDVSVVGFDGISIGQWLSPSLATTVQPAERMGEWAMHHLIERIDRGKAAANLVLPHTFRTGESLSFPPD